VISVAAGGVRHEGRGARVRGTLGDGGRDQGPELLAAGEKAVDELVDGGPSPQAPPGEGQAAEQVPARRGGSDPCSARSRTPRSILRIIQMSVNSISREKAIDGESQR